MRSVLYVVLPVEPPARDTILEVQREYDPRLSRDWPPHVTLAGSSGMGPIAGDVTTADMRRVLEPIARETPPIEMAFDAAMRFMQSNVIVLPLDPHGPLRALHERIKLAGLPYAHPRFAFTPHVTLSFYREQPPARVRELLAVRVAEPARFTEISVYRSFMNRTSRLELSLALG